MSLQDRSSLRTVFCSSASISSTSAQRMPVASSAVSVRNREGTPLESTMASRSLRAVRWKAGEPGTVCGTRRLAAWRISSSCGASGMRRRCRCRQVWSIVSLTPLTSAATASTCKGRQHGGVRRLLGRPHLCALCIAAGAACASCHLIAASTRCAGCGSRARSGAPET